MTTESYRERVLVVEDEPKIAQAVALGLRAADYDVVSATTGEDAFFMLHSHAPAIMVLDLGLPRRGGMEVLRQVRALGIAIPILILTSNASLEDRVAALDAGADDFLLKPFSTPELCARVRAISRRGKPTASSKAALQVEDVNLNLATRTATRADRKLELTAREFDLLLYFAEHSGQTISREMLAREVWRETARFTPIDNVIDVQMTRLRRKLDDPFTRKLIRTIRGLGFTFGESES